MGDEDENSNSNQSFHKLTTALRVHNNTLRESLKGLNVLPNNSFFKQIEEATRPLKDLQNILDKTNFQSTLLDSIKLNKNSFSNIASSRIHDTNPPTRISTLDFIHDIPKNPVHDTNEKLQSIEEQFDKMLEVMVNAATIANDIQANASSFIGQFEAASQQTNASAKTAIRVGVIAIGIAILTPLVSIGMDVFLPNPTVAAIETFSREVAASQQSQTAIVERLVTEFRSGDEAIAKGLVAELRTSQEKTNSLLHSLLKQLTEVSKENLSKP